MIRIISYFKPVGKTYKSDIFDVFEYIKKEKNLKNLELIFNKKKRSPLFLSEYENFRICFESGLGFFEAWKESFTDPLMAYIVQYGDMDCILDYVERKEKLWTFMFQKNTYGFILVFFSIFSFPLLNNIFPGLPKSLLLYFLLIITSVFFLFYFLLIVFVRWFYKYYCNSFLFVRYFEQKISLSDFLKLKKAYNIEKLIEHIQKNKFDKEDILKAKLELFWKILMTIPMVFSLLVVFLCFLFFILIIWFIFKTTISQIEGTL